MLLLVYSIVLEIGVFSDSVITFPPLSSMSSVGVSSSIIKIFMSAHKFVSGEFRDPSGGYSFNFIFTKSSALFSLFDCLPLFVISESIGLVTILSMSGSAGKPSDFLP